MKRQLTKEGSYTILQNIELLVPADGHYCQHSQPRPNFCIRESHEAEKLYVPQIKGDHGIEQLMATLPHKYHSSFFTLHPSTFRVTVEVGV